MVHCKARCGGRVCIACTRTCICTPLYGRANTHAHMHARNDMHAHEATDALCWQMPPRGFLEHLGEGAWARGFLGLDWQHASNMRFNERLIRTGLVLNWYPRYAR